MTLSYNQQVVCVSMCSFQRINGVSERWGEPCGVIYQYCSSSTARLGQYHWLLIWGSVASLQCTRKYKASVHHQLGSVYGHMYCTTSCTLDGALACTPLKIWPSYLTYCRSCISVLTASEMCTSSSESGMDTSSVPVSLKCVVRSYR